MIEFYISVILILVCAVAFLIDKLIKLKRELKDEIASNRQVTKQMAARIKGYHDYFLADKNPNTLKKGDVLIRNGHIYASDDVTAFSTVINGKSDS